jgi:hypothetical protein
MNVTQALISNNGFSMQLNAFNPTSPSVTTSWLQYAFIASGQTIQGTVQYWNIGAFGQCCAAQNCSANPNACVCSSPTSTCPVITTPVFQFTPTIVSVPSSNNLPAGYNLQIQLSNDNAGNITKATFVVIDNNGNSHSQSISLPSGSQFPISAFLANIVGPGNAASTTFTSGAATLTYQVSSGQLCLEGELPDSLCSGSGTGTAETSNATYGQIAPCCGSQLTQSVTG